MRIFSGIQPTGELHIGNYLGAIKQWIELQEKNECVFCIVDLHAITQPFDEKKLQESIEEKVIAYLAAGVDPEKSIVFVQSKVKEHAELAWLLNAIVPLGELKRMTQYKEKEKKIKEITSAGLLNYPILMTADILLYQTDLVPVGKDQKQHVELTRFIAKKFNQKYGQTFKVPEVKIPRLGAKIMSLVDPSKKMSKSDKPESRINLFDEPKDIEKKIAKATTDTGSIIKYDPVKKPGISNLLTIYHLFSDKDIKEIEKEFKGKKYQNFKKALAETLVLKLEPFRRKKKELESRKVYLKQVLELGAKRAEIVAQSTIDEVKKKMGLL